jgi:lysophospholipase L1-like esterase
MPVKKLPATVASEWTGVREAPSTAAARASTAPKGTWVLHIGDSFVDASFQQNLRPHFLATGSKYFSNAATAAYTTQWASDRDLDGWLARRPSLVIVTLGANEVDVPFPLAHARAIAGISRKIAAAGAACVWTTPPLWKGDDKGILQVIHDYCAPCLFFDSDAVMGGLETTERRSDRIHPNELGGARWAQAFWAWLAEHRDDSTGPWHLVPYERRG